MKFDKEGVVSKTHKESKMFKSETHDQMTTGHYNQAGTHHGVGIAPRVGTEKAKDRDVIPKDSFCWRYDEYDE